MGALDRVSGGDVADIFWHDSGINTNEHEGTGLDMYNMLGGREKIDKQSKLCDRM